MNTTLKPGQIVQHPKQGYGIVVAVDYGEAIEYAHRDLGVACQTSDSTGWEPVEVVKPGHVQVRVDDLHEHNYPNRVIERRAHEAWQDWANRRASAEPVRLMHPEPTQRAAKASIYFEFIGPARLLRESSGSWVDQYGKTWTWDEADAAGSLVLGWGDDEDDADEPAKLSHPEPTQRGAKASYITWKGERRIRLIRTGYGEEPWISENGLPWSWDELTEADGKNITLLIGWGDGQ